MPLLSFLRKGLPPILSRYNAIYRNPTFIRRFTDTPFEEIPPVSPSIIKKTLKQYSVDYNEGHTCYVANCPICKKQDKTKIYINKNTGEFLGPVCSHSGHWRNLEEYLTAPKKKKALPFIENSVNADNKRKERVKSIEEDTLLLENVSKEIWQEMFAKCELPVLEEVPLKVRIDKTYTKLYFPLEDVESSIVGYRVINTETKRQSADPCSTNSTGLITGLSVKNKETAVLVPNLLDFMVLLDNKLSCSIVCLPNAPLKLPPRILPSLERFNKLVLWFGNNVNSWDSARNFAKKLGEKRCLFVRPTDKQPLPHLLKSRSEIKSIISEAQPIWHKSITTFSSLRQDVLSDLQNIDKVQGVKWKRYPTLNKIVKGHRKGELTVITGPTGCGKTTFISDYSLDLAMQGVNTLWGSFEIRNARLARTMLQQMALLPLDENLNQFDKWADEFEKLPIYFMTFHGQQSIKVVMEAVEHATYVHDISHVIIDNLQFMMGMSEESKHMDRFWKQDVIISAFRSFATKMNCHVTLVIHPRKERDDEELTTSSIFGGAKASQEADNVMIIQDKRLQSLRGKKYLQIAKNRYSGDLGIMPLDFDKKSLSFMQKRNGKDKDKDKTKEEKDAELSASEEKTMV